MKVVITGGAGFIGLNLARRLVLRGALTGPSGEAEEIDGIVLFDAVTPEVCPPGLDGRVDIVTGDVSDRDTVSPARRCCHGYKTGLSRRRRYLSAETNPDCVYGLISCVVKS